MTTRKLNQIIYARTEKIFELWSKGKLTLEENMEMYIRMIDGYQRKYPIQMGEIFAKPAPLVSDEATQFSDARSGTPPRVNGRDTGRD
jgi:hypothetical protein